MVMMMVMTTERSPMMLTSLSKRILHILLRHGYGRRRRGVIFLLTHTDDDSVKDSG